MPFIYDEFHRLTGGFHLLSSPIDVLRQIVKEKHITYPKGHAAKLISLIQHLPSDTKQKYERGLAYLIDNYDPLITDDPPVAQHPMRAGARIRFRDDITGAKLDRGDLLYGIGETFGRAAPEYMGVLFTGPRYADVYNNGLGVGTGQAFGKGREWQDRPATRADVEDFVAGKAAAIAPGSHQGAERTAHAAGLAMSKFAPTTVFDADRSKLQKDLDAPGWNTPHAEEAARWNKAIRRSCKYGIEMIATNALFVSKHAEVHFVLDGMGDLSNMALKKTRDEILHRPRQTSLVPITSSELCFVFRNWETILHRVVRFWVNGLEVQAPWLSRWSEPDVKNKNVMSGWHAWQRYKLKRKLLKGKG